MSKARVNSVETLDGKGEAVFSFDYEAGLILESYGTIVRDGDKEYKLSKDTTLPYTTTGNGMPENGSFVLVGGGGVQVIDPLDYGAVGDGVTDDSTAFQQAIDDANATGGAIRVPAGAYLIGAALDFKSNVTFFGEAKNSTRLIVNDGYTAKALGGDGSLEAEVELSGTWPRGTRTVTTKTAHGLSEGDYIRVIGQRVATSDDAGDNWRLGYGTGGGTVYFGEFHRVFSVESTTEFTTFEGPVFEGYRGDDTQETHIDARTSTTFQKVNFVENVTIRDITVEVRGAHNGVFRFGYGREILIENCAVEHGIHIGYAVYFQNCLSSKAKSITSEFDAGIDIVNNKEKYNSLLTASSQRCGFEDCTLKRISQGVDFSYNNGGTCSLECHARGNVVYEALTSGLTSHPGTYACSFVDNKIYNSRQGIACRSRNSIIVGNFAQSSEINPFESVLQYGFGLYDGWAVNCVVSGNIAVGFSSGFMVADGAGEERLFGRIDSVFTGNTSILCDNGFRRYTSGLNDKTEMSGLVVMGNTFSNCRITHVAIGGPCPGVDVSNNVCNGLSEGSASIALLANSHPHSRVTGNRINNIPATSVGIDVTGETITFPYTVNRTCEVERNIITGDNAGLVQGSSTRFNLLANTTTQAPGREGQVYLSNSTPTPGQITDYASLYVDETDGDLKVHFGNGTIATIATN